MNIRELQELLNGRAFRSTVCGMVYRFLNGNTIENNCDHSAPYSIQEEGNNLILKHGNLMGDDNLIIEVEHLKYPMTFSFYKKSDLGFFTTFIEE